MMCACPPHPGNSTHQCPNQLVWFLYDCLVCTHAQLCCFPTRRGSINLRVAPEQWNWASVESDKTLWWHAYIWQSIRHFVSRLSSYSNQVRRSARILCNRTSCTSAPRTAWKKRCITGDELRQSIPFNLQKNWLSVVDLIIPIIVEKQLTLSPSTTLSPSDSINSASQCTPSPESKEKVSESPVL